MTEETECMDRRPTTGPLDGPPTPLEAEARKRGATEDRYHFDYRMLPMRDGARLATVIIRPCAGARVPTLLMRTPYRSARTHELPYDVFSQAFQAGWAVVIQNERGTGWSDGPYTVIGHGTADCEDTLTWIEAQPWSNGACGLIGCSSPAENQLRIASQGHRALRAAVPMSAGAGIGNIPGCEGNHGFFYKGGIPVLAQKARWYHPSAVLRRPELGPENDPDTITRALRNFVLISPGGRDPDYARALDRVVHTPPSGDVLKRMGVPETGFDTYMRAGPLDPIWDEADHLHAYHRGGATPQLHINGWLDFAAYETVKLFEFQQHHPDQYLIMAASSHCAMIRSASRQAMLGDRPVGNTTFPYDDIIWAWFRRFLSGEESAWTAMPKVQVFLIGGNQWLTGESWPLTDRRLTTLHLASGGNAQSLWGDGVLQPRPDARAHSCDDVLADPDNPVPSLGMVLGSSPIVCDQRAAEARSDVLVYSTPPLSRGMAVVGDVGVVLHVSTDVPDTDLFVKLVDVFPDGTALNVAWSCLRMRYRTGYRTPSLLEAGRIYEVRIGGITTATYFAPGHQVRLEVAGSNFPLVDRNWHTGGPNAEEREGQVARITLHHDAAHPSRMELWEYTGPLRGESAPPCG
ncbi:MAG: CocE/NonD family hydrolase [Firmicutes bacterium]|nr:CocE/NonD family hydrolase [Bacillota bacterium]